MKLKPFYLVVMVFLLGACAETELVSHAVKNVVSGGAPTKAEGTFKVGNPYQIAGRTYVPKETYSHTETGVASWYGPNFHGKRTANGEIFDKHQLTAAHRTLQMPSLIRVTNLANGRSLVLRVNDRGPFSKNRVLDVSERAAELLDFKRKGTTKVKIQVLTQESEAIAEAAKRGEDTRGMEVAVNENRLMRSQTLVRTPQTPTRKPVQIAKVEPVPLTKPIEPISSAPVTKMEPVFEPSHIAAVTQPAAGPGIYVQAGAFGSETNATNFAKSLRGFGNAQVFPTTFDNGSALYRVRIGPVADQDSANVIVASLADAGKGNALIVVD